MGRLLRIELEDDEEDLLKAAKWIYWTSVTLGGLEEVLRSRICPLVRILSWSTPAAA